MLRLFSGARSGNCHKVRLLPTQRGIPFEVVETNAVRGDQRPPAYLKKNPNGKVPTVELDDGDRLPESGAILVHFARGAPLWPDDPREQTRVRQRMFFGPYSHEPNLAAGGCSIADIALYASTHAAHEGGCDRQHFPAIGSWLKRVAAQPGHIPITHAC